MERENKEKGIERLKEHGRKSFPTIGTFRIQSTCTPYQFTHHNSLLCVYGIQNHWSKSPRGFYQKIARSLHFERTSSERNPRCRHEVDVSGTACTCSVSSDHVLDWLCIPSTQSRLLWWVSWYGVRIDRILKVPIISRDVVSDSAPVRPGLL